MDKLNNGQFINGLFFPSEQLLNFTDDEFTFIINVKNIPRNWCSCINKKYTCNKFVFYKCITCNKLIKPKDIHL
jgi:hypothetical protein